MESSMINDEKFYNNQILKTKYDELREFSDENEFVNSIRLSTNSLFFQLPRQLCEGSREKFINLLEFANDTLHCKNVIIYFDKTRSDRALLVKTFMFLGFHLLSPENKLILVTDEHPNCLFMVYFLDDDNNNND